MGKWNRTSLSAADDESNGRRTGFQQAHESTGGVKNRMARDLWQLKSMQVSEDNGGERRMSGVIGTVIGMVLGFASGFVVGFALGGDAND